MFTKKRLLKLNEPMEIVPPPTQKFTIDQWRLDNQARFRKCNIHCQLVESLIAESERICDSTLELTKTNKTATDYELKEKLTDVKFVKDEILRHRKDVILEIDALKTYKARLIDGLSSIQENAADICKKCLIAREHRLGIDLTVDDVEKELKKELEVISRADSIFTRTLEHTNEQIRILKSLLYYLDGDLENKDRSIQLDQRNLSLKETSLNLKWDLHTDEIVMSTMKQMNSTRVLRCYIDNILKEINITRLEKNIAEKEGFLALAHTRLGNRCHRPNLELTRDQVEQKLVQEVYDIRQTVAKLQQTLNEAHATLRYLLSMQIQLEEDINIKTNTLKIDEIECMTLRQSLNYHAY
ncbi:Similar to TEKT1: Tektin-1 (Homo sapiens) [Cotesia congregata]|uniref:Tektin n=1 Tax=Cotesia congregata TaxID=51543 RepID=A0A8J2HRD4_COTCN|nr:Similar to TEKT1: Tektin-1 (Homo sapiens) [Cotesia congregata]